MESTALYQRLIAEKFLIAGPCVVEDDAIMNEIAETLEELREKFEIPVIFKASFDKANRTSVSSYRGRGMEHGLEALGRIGQKHGLPLITDIHESHQAQQAAEVVDILQIPAFLCRQTDLLLAAAETGKIVNVKKGQFLSGHDMAFVVKKLESSGNSQILLTERGNMYGYNNLVVDFRNIVDMLELGYPVVMDATHAVQRPGGAGGSSGGNRGYVPQIAKAAAIFGASGFFFEVHPDPEKALSDSPNTISLTTLRKLAETLFME